MLLIYTCLLRVRNIVKSLCWIEQLILLWAGNVLTLIKVIIVMIKPHFYTNWLKTSSGVFGTQLNIYDGAFLQK